MTETQTVTSADPPTSGRPIGAGPLAPLPYHDGPTGAVVASEAALVALRRTRPWALVFAAVLWLYAAAGGTIGGIWLFVLLTKRIPQGVPLGQFIVGSSVNLVFAPVALIGGILAVRYCRAAGRAYWRRSSDDLERALIHQRRLWVWAGVTTILVFAFPVILIGVAMWRDEWP